MGKFYEDMKIKHKVAVIQKAQQDLRDEKNLQILISGLLFSWWACGNKYLDDLTK
jgi:hypothetical protein